MKWFKHYHNADTSHKLCLLMEQHGKVAYAEYWLLLELLCEKYQGNESEVSVTEGELCRKLRKPFPKKMKTFLKALQNLSILEFKVFEKTFKFETSILSELKQKDFRKPQINRAATAIKPLLRGKREEIRGKREEEEEEHSVPPPVKHGPLSESDIFNAWKNYKEPRYSCLSPIQVQKLLELNAYLRKSGINAEKYHELAERVFKTDFFLGMTDPKIDLILSPEVIIRAQQETTLDDVRKGALLEN